MKTEASNFLTMRQVLYHLYMSLFEEVQQQYGMTQMEINLLLQLANNPEIDTAAQVVKSGKLSKSQVSTAVDHLVNSGYLTRSLDGRRIHLRLLPLALEVVEEGRHRQAIFREAVFEGISVEEQEKLNDIMLRIVTNARSAEKKLHEGKMVD